MSVFYDRSGLSAPIRFDHEIRMPVHRPVFDHQVRVVRREDLQGRADGVSASSVLNRTGLSISGSMARGCVRAAPGRRAPPRAAPFRPARRFFWGALILGRRTSSLREEQGGKRDQ